MDHSKASVIAEVVQAQSNSSDLFKQSIYAGECFSLASEQFAVYFSLRMRTLSMVLRPYIYIYFFFFFGCCCFPLHLQEPSMVTTEEAQEQEVGV